MRLLNIAAEDLIGFRSKFMSFTRGSLSHTLVGAPYVFDIMLDYSAGYSYPS